MIDISFFIYSQLAGLLLGLNNTLNRNKLYHAMAHNDVILLLEFFLWTHSTVYHFSTQTL